MDSKEHTERVIAKHLRQRKNKFEALAWLKESGGDEYHSLAEWSNEESVEQVERLYAAGAREVWAVAFDKNLPYESINTLILTLPENAAARNAVFGWVNDHVQRQGLDTEEDYGQSHLYPLVRLKSAHRTDVGG